MTFTPKHALLAGAGLLMLPVPAMAQDTTTTVDNYSTQPVEREDDDDDFPWGLLGLAGLAGLLGRKKHDDADIRVDARRDNRP